jgi:DNA gyrase subunit A
MDVISPHAYVLSVTQNGFGKLVPVGNYPVHKRGGKGVRTLRVSPKTGKVAVSRLVSPQGSLVMLSANGNVERIPMEQVSIQGRNSRGVHLMNLDEGDSVVSLATLDFLAG